MWDSLGFCLLNACTGHVLNDNMCWFCQVSTSQVVDINLSSVPVIKARKFNPEINCSEQLCDYCVK